MPSGNDNPSENVRHLRDQVTSIQRDAAAEREEVAAAVSETVDRVGATAEDAAQAVNNQYETVAESIRAHPFATMFCAAAVGFVLARAFR